MAVRPIFCCDFCGRDTRRRGRICSLCLGTGPEEADGPEDADVIPDRDEQIQEEVEQALREAMG